MKRHSKLLIWFCLFLLSQSVFSAPKISLQGIAKLKRYSLNIHTDQENLIVYYLNAFRMHPKVMAENFKASEYYDSENENCLSLYTTLSTMDSITTYLQVDTDLYTSAKCHAEISGKSGKVGHERISNCVANFHGECISYGAQDALAVVMQLLIDNGVPSLGHRKICLSDGFLRIGIKQAKHKVYGINTVLDFG